MIFLLILICPILLGYYIDKLFFSEKSEDSNISYWILLVINFSAICYAIYELGYSVEGAIARGIVGLLSFLIFLFGILKIFKLKNSSTETKLKIAITLVVLLIIGYGLCTSEGLF